MELINSFPILIFPHQKIQHSQQHNRGNYTYEDYNDKPDIRPAAT